MSIKHTDSDGFVDLGGYGFYVTEAEDMGGYTVREPVRNEKIDLDRETGDFTVVKEHPLEKRAREEYYEALEALARGRR